MDGKKETRHEWEENKRKRDDTRSSRKFCLCGKYDGMLSAGASIFCSNVSGTYEYMGAAWIYVHRNDIFYATYGSGKIWCDLIDHGRRHPSGGMGK